MSKPNLLFIFTDEQRFDTMAAYGNTQIHMPNLNRLTQHSTVFDQAYVTQPVCTPSRSSLMTGLYPHTNGCTRNNIALPHGVACLNEMIDDPDYVSGYHGKWHLGDEIFCQHGFDDWVSIEDAYVKHYSPTRDRNTRSSYHHFLTAHGYTPANGSHFGRGEAARLPEPISKPAFLAESASRFIREHASHPFALFVNFLEPHMPFYGPRDNQYDPNDIPLPANFENTPEDNQSLKTRLLHRRYCHQGQDGIALDSEAGWRRLIANYWGLCSLVDTHVGTILDTLTRCGLDDQTIVVYTSDHGDMMGSHQLVAKCVMFEEAVRVPLLIRVPGQTTTRRVTGPVSQIDLVPTLLDLMNRPVPSHLQGQSLAGVLRGDAEPIATDDVVIQWNGSDGALSALVDGQPAAWAAQLAPADRITEAISDPVRTIVTPDGWKFSHSPAGQHELYDLGNDPLETQNLAGQPSQQSRMADLTRRIRNWQQRVDDIVEPATI